MPRAGTRGSARRAGLQRSQEALDAVAQLLTPAEQQPDPLDPVEPELDERLRGYVNEQLAPIAETGCVVQVGSQPASPVAVRVRDRSRRRLRHQRAEPPGSYHVDEIAAIQRKGGRTLVRAKLAFLSDGERRVLREGSPSSSSPDPRGALS
jgi:hypothetical protein